MTLKKRSMRPARCASAWGFLFWPLILSLLGLFPYGCSFLSDAERIGCDTNAHCKASLGDDTSLVCLATSKSGEAKVCDVDEDGNGIADAAEILGKDELMCLPNCVDRDCGPDFCGGECGGCETSEGYHASAVCLNGQCCVPKCATRECGNDGCGGSCGSCSSDWHCGSNGECFDPCEGKHCGDDGYGGSCGTCSAGWQCGEDQTCFDPCESKECGDDGYGGSCGSCNAGWQCSESQVCFEPCEGKECGDDGYGGSCGSCNAGWQCSSGTCQLSPTWTDPDSGLMWQVEPTGGTMGWADANSHCSSLDLDGYTDWRLPDISELRSLIRGCPDTELGSSTCNVQLGGCLDSTCNTGDLCDHCSYNGGPADGCYWPDEMQGDFSCYWSSSVVAGVDYVAWHVCFYRGKVIYSVVVGSDGHARCVR